MLGGGMMGGGLGSIFSMLAGEEDIEIQEVVYFQNL
jgi:hypothetical protein